MRKSKFRDLLSFRSSDKLAAILCKLHRPVIRALSPTKMAYLLSRESRIMDEAPCRDLM